MMPPSAARSHLPREPDTDEVRSITGRITSIHTAADNPHSRQPSFRQTGFSEVAPASQPSLQWVQGVPVDSMGKGAGHGRTARCRYPKAILRSATRGTHRG